MISDLAAVVFDFDGTLVDSATIKREAFYEATFEIQGSDRLVEQLLSADPPLDRYQIMWRVASSGTPLVPDLELIASDLASRYSQICRERITKAPEINGATAIIRALFAQSIPMYISSATPIAELTTVVSARPWSRFIRKCFGSPDTKINHLQKVMDSENAPAENILMIGDLKSDKDAAMSLGCMFGAVGSAHVELGEAYVSGENLVVIKDQLFDERIK